MPSATWSTVVPCLFWPIEQYEVNPTYSITPSGGLRNTLSPTVPFARFPRDQFTGSAWRAVGPNCGRVLNS